MIKSQVGKAYNIYYIFLIHLKLSKMTFNFNSISPGYKNMENFFYLSFKLNINPEVMKRNGETPTSSDICFPYLIRKKQDVEIRISELKNNDDDVDYSLPISQIYTSYQITYKGLDRSEAIDYIIEKLRLLFSF